MAGSTSAPLVNPAVSASGEVDSLLIEKFTGKVHEEYLKGENLQAFFDMQQVVGTNMVSNKYIGETDLQAMVPGQEAEGTEVEYDKNALVVDTAVIARNVVAQLHDVQSDIDGNKSKLSRNQVKKIKQLEDEMILQQLIFGAISNTEAARVTPRVKGHGFSIKIDVSDAQAAEADSVLAAIEMAITEQRKQEVDTSDMIAVLPLEEYDVLMDAERLVNRDFTTESGVTMNGYVLKGKNIPVMPSNRFPTTAHTGDNHHLLSKASNQFRYDVTAEMLNCICVIFTTDALLLGSTIQLQGDIFWDKKTKSYFIDSWFSEGAIPDRWEAVSAIFKGGSENAAVKARAVRKARRQVTVTA